MKPYPYMPQKVLIIAQENGFNSYVAECLQDLGSRHVICATSLESANKINQELQFNWDNWDCVIVNLDLLTQGSDFLNQVKDKKNFYFITTHNNESNGLLAARYSLNHLIFKPFSPEDLRYHLSEI